MLIASVFPGQGSQAVGMGRFLFDNFSSVQRLFEEASDTLHTNMKVLCFEGPESDLALTENTQPALLLVSTSYNTALRECLDFKPAFSAGHSLGEYSALVSAGVLKFSEALRAVRVRGQAMQSACPVGEGGMAAVLGWEDEAVEALCQWVEKTSGIEPLRPANFNSPGQIVISGKQKALEWLKANADKHPFEGKRLKMIPLNVSAPFHSPLMRPAQERMENLLAELVFEAPAFPIVQNTTAQETSNPEVLRRELVAQVSAPVKWTQSVQKMKRLGVSRFIELGHGKVLAGLCKKIDPSIEVQGFSNLEELKSLTNPTNWRSE